MKHQVNTLKDIGPDHPLHESIGSKFIHALHANLAAIADDPHPFASSEELTKWLQNQLQTLITPHTLVANLLITDPAAAMMPSDWRVESCILLVFKDLTWGLVGNRDNGDEDVAFGVVLVGGSLYTDLNLDEVDDLPLPARISALQFLDMLEPGIEEDRRDQLEQARLYLMPSVAAD